MKLSIIIPTWNTADITIKCVQTIFSNLKDVDYEIVVVDNGSSDDTVEKFKKIKNVTLIENGSNLGFSKANNVGVKQAKGEWLLFLNSDMELLDNTLNDMVLFAEKNNVGAIGPMFLNIDLSPQASVFPPQTAINAFKEFWLSIPSAYSKYIPDSNSPAEVSNISGGALLINHDVFKEIGGWNEKYFFYFEDMDLCRQIRQINKTIYYYPKCKVIHRHGASGINLASSANQWRRLIPSSKIYHGKFNHYLINLIIWSGQKFQRVKKAITKTLNSQSG
ncbi:MAG: glycosyltransferase family 2 protein [Candidatus Shapirobacteria bacterium]|nr:glycosyltransferase family 2 protein [Candidatus Shapirobacteria bacterium]